MSTEAGATILKTVDSTTEMAQLLLDKYLPAPEEEDCWKLGSLLAKNIAERSRSTIFIIFQTTNAANTTIFTTLYSDLANSAAEHRGEFIWL